jgi:Protein of unknown function (DUF3237)
VQRCSVAAAGVDTRAQAVAAQRHLITLRFETSAVQYAWLQPGVVIRRGALISGGVSYQVYAV